MAEAVQTVGAQEEREARLVAGLRAGDPAAQAELCDRYGPRLHRYLVTRLGQRADLAEDLMIQSLTQAVRHFARYDPRRASLTAWLYGIARREVQLELRRRHRRSSVPETAQVPMESLCEQAAPEDLAEVTAARLEAQRQVARLEGYLSELEVEVLVLRTVHQLSVRELGHVLGRSERAIDSLLHRAKQKARERLADDAG